jgi:hypothetical protein
MSGLGGFLLATAAGISILAFMAGLAVLACITVRTVGGAW